MSPFGIAERKQVDVRFFAIGSRGTLVRCSGSCPKLQSLQSL
jgi:hypothetical protein